MVQLVFISGSNAVQMLFIHCLIRSNNNRLKFI